MKNHNPYVVLPGKSRRGEPLLLRGADSVSWKVSGSDTEGRVATFEGVVSPGAGPVLHLHHRQNEWWYVLEGLFVFQVGNERFRVQPGTSVFGPRGIPYAFQCLSDGPVKMLLSFDPAERIEEFFDVLAKLGANAGAGQHSEREVLHEYGVEFVGPPLRID